MFNFHEFWRLYICASLTLYMYIYTIGIDPTFCFFHLFSDTGCMHFNPSHFSHWKSAPCCRRALAIVGQQCLSAGWRTWTTGEAWWRYPEAMHCYYYCVYKKIYFLYIVNRSSETKTTWWWRFILGGDVMGGMKQLFQQILAHGFFVRFAWVNKTRVWGGPFPRRLPWFNCGIQI